jgi:hypothetical protein
MMKIGCMLDGLGYCFAYLGSIDLIGVRDKTISKGVRIGFDILISSFI